MPSNIRRTQFNTRERVLSTDFNDSTSLHHRALVESLRAVAAPNTSMSGVVSGYVVTVPGGGLSVNVSAGIGLLFGVALTPLDSEYQWVEMRTPVIVDLTALVDSGNPRWAVVEALPNETVETSSLRDVFNPALGTFTPQTLTKIIGSDPTIQVRGGAATANPTFPTGVAGAIPLAYVYIQQSATTLLAGDEVLCRPTFGDGQINTSARPLTDIMGGGINQPSADEIEVVTSSGRFRNQFVRWSLPGNSRQDVSAGSSVGGFYPPASNTAVKFYGIPPVYPVGYTATLSPREFVPGDSASGRLGAGIFPGARNVLVVASLAEPAPDTAQGAPATTGIVAVTIGGFGTINISTDESVYLGSAIYDASLAGFAPQEVRGTQVLTTTTGSAPSRDLMPDATVNLWLDVNGNQVYPTTARVVYAGVLHATAAGTLSSGSLSPSGMNARYGIAINNASAQAQVIDDLVTLTVTGAGTTDAVSLNLTNFSYFGRGYWDSVLGRR